MVVIFATALHEQTVSVLFLSLFPALVTTKKGVWLSGPRRPHCHARSHLSRLPQVNLCVGFRGVCTWLKCGISVTVSEDLLETETWGLILASCHVCILSGLLALMCVTRRAQLPVR